MVKGTTITLTIEALLMTIAEAAWIALRLRGAAGIPAQTYLAAVLSCLGFAVGLQSGAMLQLKIPGIVTTYITGTWTSLISGLTRLSTSKKREEPKQKLQFEERLLMQGGILAVYFLAALLTGWLFTHQPLAIGGLSAASVWAVALYAAFRKRHAAE